MSVFKTNQCNKKSVDSCGLTLVSIYVGTESFLARLFFANTNRNITLSFRFSSTYYHVSGQYIPGSSVHISTEDIPSALPCNSLYCRTSARMQYCARINCLHELRLFLTRVLWQNRAGFNSVIRLPVIYFLDFHRPNAVMSNLGSDFKQLGHEVETERDCEIVHHAS